MWKPSGVGVCEIQGGLRRDVGGVGGCAGGRPRRCVWGLWICGLGHTRREERSLGEGSVGELALLEHWSGLRGDLVLDVISAVVLGVLLGIGGVLTSYNNCIGVGRLMG